MMCFRGGTRARRPEEDEQMGEGSVRMKPFSAAILTAALVLSACSAQAEGPLRAERPTPALSPTPPTPLPAPPIPADPGLVLVRQNSPRPLPKREVVVYYLTLMHGRQHLVGERHVVEETPRIATAAMEKLLHGTPHRRDHLVPFPKKAVIRGVTISQGVATVDWSSDVLEASMGANSEWLAIQAAVWTLTEFPSIKEVRFTVEGKDQGVASNGRLVEDWWGHVGLYDQPWSRDMSLRVLREGRA
jgi:germination protein M